jgi:hypothetical protein
MKETREPIYFAYTNQWYKGKMPSFYESESTPHLNILEDNFEEIKNEILDFLSTKRLELKSINVPFEYSNDKWKILTLITFLISYKKNLNKLPLLSNLLEKIPGLVTAQISILGPKSKIPPHFGSSNALIRSHLGIVVPDNLPKLGIRVKSEERCWEEGKMTSFCESHRHYVWNNSDSERIVLLIDTIHPDYIKKKYFICSGVISLLLLRGISLKFPILKKANINTEIFFHLLISFFVKVSLFVLVKTNFDFGTFISKIRLKS